VRRTTTTRRGLAAAALALTLGLTLAACSGDSGDNETPSASPSATTAVNAADEAALEGVVVEGDLGAEPTVTLPSTPFDVTTIVIRIVEPGTGATLEEGQLLSLASVSFSGADGSVVEGSSTYATAPDQVALDAALGDLHDKLVGQKVGVRFVFAAPPSAEGEATNVVVAEVTDAVTIPSRASGETVTPPAGLPTVTLDADGAPTVTPVSTPAPTALVAQTLIKGTGAPVTADQTLTVQYSLYLWDGTAVESSWDNGATATFALSNVIAGWTEGLTGQTVGSQVLLVVPPDKGYGDKASDTIPANSTLIFVVDILAAS
jgi:FKBP-type peptidyl-prolyl isomerase-like protein